MNSVTGVPFLKSSSSSSTTKKRKRRSLWTFRLPTTMTFCRIGPSMMSLLLLSIFDLFTLKVAANLDRCLFKTNCVLDEKELNVACSGDVFDQVPLCLSPRLLRLSLHKTMIHTVYLASFIHYEDLKYVNLSHSPVSVIEKKAFESQDKLEELYLNDNKISYLDSEIFLGLKNLHVLSLRGNLLEEVPDGVFQQMPRLEQLDLSHNRITTIGNEMLRGLPRLTVLLLSQNRLKTIPSTTLVQVPHLAEFSIGGNNFKAVHKKEFEALRSLTFLDLSGTDFSNGIESTSFEYIADLRSLKLNDCSLKEVPTAALSKLGELEELELNRNFLVDIPKGAFSANRRLKILRISGNPNLERISPGSLRDNLNLVQVDFSRNRHLTFLPPDDFRFLTSLSTLDLHGDNLNYIPQDAVSWSDIPTWYLHDNPITCNCSSAWLRKMLISRNQSTSSTLRCAEPQALQGIPLSSTELSDLFCGLDAATQGVVIALSVCGLLLVLASVAFFLLYLNRGSCVRQLLKGQKWSRASRSASRSYDSEYPCIKPVPVTEL
ncbi:UNVERIFIED_CONTAM: hypothetical protein RMT77_008492 [Armadillidium vulgare]|nr:Platelet glycoprotein V [Armadillidium vulgare]